MTEAAIEAPAAAEPAPAKKGVIHDLGYARYAGERRSPSTLWRVIMRHQISYTWKTWWRWKPALIGAVITMVSVGLVMYLSRDKMFDALRHNGVAVRFLDGLIPLSIRFFRMCAFVVTMTVASTGIARDRETGAFGFYFCRPVRPRDYVLGKLAGMTVVMATLMLAGPLLLTAFRIGLARDTDEMVKLLPWLGRTVLVGGLASLLYAAMPMALSAIIGRRWIALGVWAGYWVIGTGLLAVIGFFTWKPLLALDPGAAIDSLAFRLWSLTIQNEKQEMDLVPALVGIILHIGAAVGALYWRVSREAQSAVGAGS